MYATIQFGNNLSSTVLSKSIDVKVYKTMILSFVTWSLSDVGAQKMEGV